MIQNFSHPAREHNCSYAEFIQAHKNLDSSDDNHKMNKCSTLPSLINNRNQNSDRKTRDLQEPLLRHDQPLRNLDMAHHQTKKYFSSNILSDEAGDFNIQSPRARNDSSDSGGRLFA